MWEEGRQRAAGGFVFFGKLMTAKGRLRDCDSLQLEAGCLEANSTGQIFDGAVFSLLD
jgi:hypothetical protein